jgi:hypothetical protein
MKSILTFVFVATLLPSCFATDLRGVWTASPAGEDALQFNISRENNNHFGYTMALSSFTGLTDAQVASLSETPVRFTLQREAGSFAFEGLFKMREGAGHFVFTPNRPFVEELRGLGVSMDDSTDQAGQLDERLFSYAMLDLSGTYIRAMQAEGYRESAKQYLSMRIFRVTPELVRELRLLGYDRVSAENLVKIQIHGAAPRFIRELAAVGYSHLPLEELVRFRIHGVTADAIREYRALGYDKLTSQELVRMRIHGVTPEYIRQIKAAGYDHVPAEKLITMRIHGIDGDFARGMRDTQ